MNFGYIISRPARVQGFSLVELMVVLLVLGVLLTVTIPSFNTLYQNNRLYTQANDFHLSLSRARSEAMSRVQRITVCPSTNGSSCASGGAWENGWIIFTESHGSQNAAVDPNEVVLEIQQAISGGNTLRGSSNVANYVSYDGTGFSTLVSGTVQTGRLALCDLRGLSNGKAIVINAAGRPRVLDATDSGGVDSCLSPSN